MSACVSSLAFLVCVARTASARRLCGAGRPLPVRSSTRRALVACSSLVDSRGESWEHESLDADTTALLNDAKSPLDAPSRRRRIEP